MQPQIYTIEPASPEDAPVIADFQVAMAHETEGITLDPRTVIEGVEHIFADPGIGFYIVARNAEKKAVGSLLVLKEWSDWRNMYVWWIHSLYVSPPHRQQGVFRKLLAFVESRGRESDAAGIRLYVERENDTAKTVYVKCGMSSRRYELFEKMFHSH